MATPVASTQHKSSTTQTSASAEALRRGETVAAIALPAISAVANYEQSVFASPGVMVTFNTPEARSQFETAVFVPRSPNVASLTEKGSLFPQNLRFRSTRAKPLELFICWTNDNKLNDSTKIVEALQGIKV